MTRLAAVCLALSLLALADAMKYTPIKAAPRTLAPTPFPTDAPTEAEDESENSYPTPEPTRPTRSPSPQPTHAPIAATFFLNRTLKTSPKGKDEHGRVYIHGVGDALAGQVRIDGKWRDIAPTTNYEPKAMPDAIIDITGPTPSASQVQKAIDAINEYRADIRKLYAYEEILTQTVAPATTEYTMQLHARMRRAFLSGQPFVWAVMGMSNTAGHDNYIHESYPMVMEQALAPIMALAGMKLVVRNHAMGGTMLFPHAYCTAAVVGEDADVVGWEFSMVHPSKDDNEGFLRNVLRLSKQPVVLWVKIGSGRAAPLEEEGGPFALPPQMGRPPPTVDTESPFFHESYTRFGMSTMSAKPALWYFDRTSPLTTPELYMKTAGRGAAWHPGVLMHELYGLALAYHYSEVLKDVLTEYLGMLPKTAYYDSVKGVRARSTKGQFEDWKSAGLNLPLLQLPPQRYPACFACNESDQSTYGRPVCVTSAVPIADPAGALSTHLVAPDDIVGDFPPGNWTLNVPQGAMKHQHMAHYFGHLDYKFVYRGHSNSGWITFSIDPAPSVKKLLVCDTAHGWFREKNCVNLQENVEYYLDDTPLVFTKPVTPAKVKTDPFAWCAELPVDNVPGFVGNKHQLHARVINTANEQQYVYIQYLVWW